MDLGNKLCVVTGANSGIGKETVRAFARMGAYVIMICRNEKRAHQARQEIISDTGHHGIEVMLADLAVQFDVREVADQIIRKYDKVDVLVNNAGIIASKRQETVDGIEKTLAINHLGPFLLTNLLLNHLRKAEEARVINVASEVHHLGAANFDIDNFQLQKKYSPMKAYGLSKLYNIMFTHELAKRCGDIITTNSLHPGVVRTQLAEEANLLTKLFYTIGKPFMKSPKKGAQTTIYLATSGEISATSGKYFINKKVTAPASMAYADAITKEVWAKSAVLTGLS